VRWVVNGTVVDGRGNPGRAANVRIMGDTIGSVEPGMKADLCLFDPARVIDRATFEDPGQFPEEIARVIVNGRTVLQDREATGALPGALVRQ